MTELHELHRIPEDAHYVCSLLFNMTLDKVLLIRKQRPAWQYGHLNGIGGLIDYRGEDPRTAMSRECREESGLIIDPWDWHPFAALYRHGAFLVHFYSIATPAIQDAETQPRKGRDLPERIEIHEVARLGEQRLVHNLRWLIPLAIDPSIASLVVIREIGQRIYADPPT